MQLSSFFPSSKFEVIRFYAFLLNTFLHLGFRQAPRAWENCNECRGMNSISVPAPDTAPPVISGATASADRSPLSLSIISQPPVVILGWCRLQVPVAHSRTNRFLLRSSSSSNSSSTVSSSKPKPKPSAASRLSTSFGGLYSLAVVFCVPLLFGSGLL